MIVTIERLARLGIMVIALINVKPTLECRKLVIYLVANQCRKLQVYHSTRQVKRRGSEHLLIVEDEIGVRRLNTEWYM